MAYVTMANTNEACWYTNQGSYLELTCILKEGNITVSSTTLHSGAGKNLRELYHSFASEINKEDLVEISTDTANTFDATGGLPVVQAISGAVACIGIVLAEPSPIKHIPAASQTTWATMLAGNYYRTAKVGIFAKMYFSGTSVEAASNAITPGNSLSYDNSADGWVYARPGLLYSDNAVWDASGADTGANGFITEPIAVHYSATNTLKVGILHGLWPIRVIA